MDYNSTYEQEIDLKDLMFAVLRKWKPMILVGVIFALLLGGYKGFTTYKSGTSASAVEEAAEKYSEELLDYEETLAKLEKEIANLTAEIDAQEEYLENSVWLQISPYDVCEARADVYVTTDYTIMPGMQYQNVDPTETILQAYESLLTSVKEDVALEVGMEPRYLDELVSVSKTGRILTINVKHVNKEDAQAILNSMIAWLDKLNPQVASAIGEHTVSIVNSSVGSGVDLAHAEALKAEEEKKADLEACLEAKETELEELVEPEKNEFGMGTVVKSAVKFAVLGGVLGVFIVVFGVCVMFLMSDKVYSSKELKNRSGLKVLGALPGKTCKCPIDRWLNELEGRVFENDETVRNGLIAQNVRNCIGDRKKILVAGSVDAACMEALALAIGAELPEIKVVSGGNMLKDVDTLKKLPECDGVILVEECGVSKYADIALEIEKVKDLEKSVVGCVVIG